MLKVQQKFSSDSFAIWLLGSEDEYKFDIHINEWITPTGYNYIDFGIRIYSHDVSICNFFVPYQIELDEIEDLSDKLANETIARGIFNTDCTIKLNSNSPIIEIAYNERYENIIKLSSLSPRLTTQSEGTLISFYFNAVNNLLTTNELYIRFRLPHKTLDSLFSTKRHDYRFTFESPIITDRFNYLIRLNDLRVLPFEIRTQFSQSSQHLDRVIATLSANEQYVIEDLDCYKIRYLETNLYQNYVPNNFSCENVISYQWVKSKRNSYIINTKLDSYRIMWTSLSLYALLVILFTIIGNILWKLLTLLPWLSWLS